LIVAMLPAWKTSRQISTKAPSNGITTPQKHPEMFHFGKTRKQLRLVHYTFVMKQAVVDLYGQPNSKGDSSQFYLHIAIDLVVQVQLMISRLECML
jgi:hypothetical protein